MEQLVITAYRADELNNKIKQHIEKGYVPIGGHKVVTFHDQLRYAGNQHKDTVRSSEYSQTMRKVSQPEARYFILSTKAGAFDKSEYGIIRHTESWVDTYEKVKRAIAEMEGCSVENVTVFLEGAINQYHEQFNVSFNNGIEDKDMEFYLTDINYYE